MEKKALENEKTKGETIKKDKTFLTPEKDKRNEISTATSSEIKTALSPNEKIKKSKSSEKKNSPHKVNKISLSSQSSTEHAGCKCKKSKCLKLYCECFSNGLLCTDSCNCNSCSNKTEEENLERDVALQALIAKNPNIFLTKANLNNNFKTPEDLQKIKKVGFSNHIQQVSEKLKKGCNCKKSQCQKKYCECYEAGLKCEDYCKCEECKNTVDGKKKMEEDLRIKMKSTIEKEEPLLRKKRKIE